MLMIRAEAPGNKCCIGQHQKTLMNTTAADVKEMTIWTPAEDAYEQNRSFRNKYRLRQPQNTLMNKAESPESNAFGHLQKTLMNTPEAHVTNADLGTCKALS